MPTLPGGMELVVIAIIIVVLFGWKKLPDAARSLGRSMRIFKAEVEEMKDKPSAASRDTVSGESRREETYRAADDRDRRDDRYDRDRRDDRYGDSDRRDDRYDDRDRRDDRYEERNDDPARRSDAGHDAADERVKDQHAADEQDTYRPPTA